MKRRFVGARARLAELEVDYAKEKSRVDAMQATLFRRLREHYQKRDRLRLILDYRKKYLDSLVRGGESQGQGEGKTTSSGSLNKSAPVLVQLSSFNSCAISLSLLGRIHHF